MKRKQLRAGGKIVSPPKDSVASLYDAALRHFRAGRYAIAEERVRLALESDPQHADSLYLTGLLHACASRIDRAIDFVVQQAASIKATPNISPALARYWRTRVGLRKP